MIKDNLIGKDVHITKCSNTSLVGVQGTIVDETANTLTIDTQSGEKQVLKHIATFAIAGVEVDGQQLTKRPEERIRKKTK